MAKHSRWYVNVTKWTPCKDEWLRLTSSVAEEEVSRINQFVYKEDSKTSLIGRALIRKFLSQAVQIPSNEIVLSRTDHGRPEVCKDYIAKQSNRWPPLLDFNVSHSGDYCVLAGLWCPREHPKVTVGVDVTKIVNKNSKKELDRFLDLMSRREFLKSEWDIVERAQTERQKCINFTRLWCLKESYIKSIGLGLSFKLNRIAFEPEQGSKYNLDTDMLMNKMKSDTRVYLDDKLALDWLFQETALDDNHLVAVGYNIDGSCDQFELDESPFVAMSIESLVETLVPIRDLNGDDWVKYSGKSTKKLT